MRVVEIPVVDYNLRIRSDLCNLMRFLEGKKDE